MLKKKLVTFLLLPGILAGICGQAAAIEKKLLVEGEITEKVSAAPSQHMTPDFFYLVQNLKNATIEGRATYTAGVEGGTPNGACRLKGESLDIINTYIWLESWNKDVRAAIEKAGAEITGEDADRYLLEAWIPLSAIDQVAAIPGVRHLRRPSYGIAASGSVDSQGDANLNTNFIRSLARLNGAGIDVGVISRGLFNNTFTYETPAGSGANQDSRVRSGDLPFYDGDGDGLADPISPTSGYLGGVQLFPQTLAVHDASTDADRYFGKVPPLEFNPLPDGAAILETVHDVAPGARLFYADGTTDIQLNTSRNFLLGKGVDVIVDDVIFYDSGRFDGSSVVSRRAQQIALNNDVVYIVAAGNLTPPDVTTNQDLGLKATRFPIFVNGHFSPRPGNSNTKFHNFAEGSNAAIRDESLTISPQNGFIDVVLVWDDIWDDQNPRASDDIDLYLLNVDSPNISNPVATSTALQNGSGLPIERITTQTNGGPYSLVMSRKDTTNSARTLFSLVILRGIVDKSDIKYLTHGIAGNNADALPPVISVGAIDATKGINNVAPDSVPGNSPGPGRSLQNDYVKWFTNQVVPTVVSYSNTDTRTSQGSTAGIFVGTSAAAAHIGGLVALLRHGYRSVPSFDYYDLLRNTEIDPTLPFPTASELMTSVVAPFKNAPKFLRVNGYDAYVNFATDTVDARITRNAYVRTFGDNLPWEHSDPISNFAMPLFQKTSQGISVSPNGQKDCFGYWQTDVLSLPDGNGGTTTALRTDRLYALQVRVGTNESNPLAVPDFRLRLTTGGSDESALLVVAGVNASAANTPTDIGGKVYTLYYKPSNDEVAAQGVRFAFDLINFDATDNANATLYLQDVTFSELQTR